MLFCECIPVCDGIIKKAGRGATVDVKQVKMIMFCKVKLRTLTSNLHLCSGPGFAWASSSLS
jgi:hypothetical protein